MPTTHRDRALARARRALDAAARAASTAEQDHRRAAAAHDAATTRAHTASAEQDELAERVAAARHELESASAHRVELDRRCQQHRRALTEAEDAERPLEQVAQLLADLVDGGAPRRESELAPFAESLAERIGRLDRLGAPADATALVDWHQQLVDGTAPPRDDAVELLGRLDELEAQWQACGAGELDADPEVRAAVQDVHERRDALDAVESGPRATAAGQRARVAIEAAHRTRTELEASGRRADADELAAALEAEQAALAAVGFDSWLDYRVATSGVGTGALAQRRRVVAGAELDASVRELERVRAERAARHAELRAERDRLVQSAVRRCGIEPLGPVEEQLRHVLALPPEVQVLAAEASRSAHEARNARQDADEELRRAERELAGAVDDEGRRGDELDHLERCLHEVAAQVEESSAELDATAEALAMAEEELGAARSARRHAEAAVDELEGVSHLPADLEDLVASVVATVERRLDAERRADRDDGDADADADADEPGSTIVVQLADPLADLPVDATMQLVAALEVAGVPAELVTSRRALAGAMRRHHGAVGLAPRRRWRRLGQRRSREPVTSTR